MSRLSDAAEDDEFGDCLTAEEIAELTRADWEDPDSDDLDPEDPEYWVELERSVPCWLGLPAEEQARLVAEADPEADLEAGPAQARAAEVIDAGFTHHDGGSGGSGFAAGGALDVMLPGSELARHVAWARRDLPALSDDALAGVMDAGRRLEAWAAELKHAAVAELDGRRAGPDGDEGEHVVAEVGHALRQTRRSAQLTLDRARGLERFTAVAALLTAGIIDIPRVDVILRRVGLLPDEHAAKVLDRVLPRAGQMTTGELRAAVDRAVIAADPAAAQRRREKAQQDARVEVWIEDSGTGALAGRDLPPAEVIAADKSLDADARWLKAHGAQGSHDQLRALALLARLSRQPLQSLLAPSADAEAGPAATGPAGPGARSAGAGAHPGVDGMPPLAGSVNLTMPAAAFLGLSDNPGDVDGYGPADAPACRDLATRLAAAGPGTRWCLTLVNDSGQAVGHGCARTGPPLPSTRPPSAGTDPPGTGPPGTRPPDTGPPDTGPADTGQGPTADLAGWLEAIKITPIAVGSCGHERESAGYRPPESLRHLIKIRSPRCGEPGCRTPARRADDDHTIPYHLGGKTCECNLHPLCRRSHRTKQAPGWQVTQPEPGVLVWQLPSGRTYTNISEPYPV